MGKLGETSRLLAKRFQLDQIKVFTNLCPKSDERILLINGKYRDCIRDCIEEIYFNIEEKNKNEFTHQDIQLYNPANLLIDDINKIMITNVDYGGFMQNRIRSLSVNDSRLHIIEDEEYLEIILYLILCLFVGVKMMMMMMIYGMKMMIGGIFERIIQKLYNVK